MLNLLLFLASCALIAGFAWYFYSLGQHALTAWIALVSLLANLFVLKQIEILGLTATASDIFSVANLLGLNLLQERFGRKVARQAIWVSFSCLLFFTVMSQIHLFYEPSPNDVAHAHYYSLLSIAPRLALSSLVTFLLVDLFDSRLFGMIREKYPHIPMLWASFFTMSVSQLLDTVMFSFLGLYGLVNAVMDVIVFCYIVKFIAIANTLPFTYLSKRIFKEA